MIMRVLAGAERLLEIVLIWAKI
ncbi:hypothetical protein RB2150_06513 [Rhodobacterales bacterium HTCC2150]|nr:hypothetical protein RB2150_06513 [Rhodobacterales bacterium HTCC2150] [Rhodobacteraceae bacterium HTCC2150]